MNFNDIPNQLRTPLFFGEVSINGNTPDVASNNDPAPPLISCDGATNSVVFEENPDFTSWGSISSIVINDIEYEKPEEHPVNEIISLGDQIAIMVQGVHPNRSLVFRNIGSRSARIKIKLKQDWFDSNLISAGLHPSNNNPTVVFDNENLEVSFCLSALG
ncbi:MAG: hypothetical protein RSC05_15475 [Acinetobacter sp.]